MNLDEHSRKLLEDIVKHNETVKKELDAFIMDYTDLKNKNFKFIQSYQTFIKAIIKIKKDNKISFILLKNISIFYRNLRSFYYINLNKDLSNKDQDYIKILLFPYFMLSEFSYLIYIFIEYILFIYKDIITDINHSTISNIISSVINEKGKEIILLGNKDKDTGLCSKTDNISSLQLNDGLSFCLKNHIFLNFNLEFIINDVDIDEKKHNISNYFNKDLIDLINQIRDNLSKDVTDIKQLKIKIEEYYKKIGDKNETLSKPFNELIKYDKLETLRNKIMVIINLFEKIKKENHHNNNLSQLMISSINIFKIVIGKLNFNFFELNLIFIRLLKAKYGIIELYNKSLFHDNNLDFFINPIDEFITFIKDEYSLIVTHKFLL